MSIQEGEAAFIMSHYRHENKWSKKQLLCSIYGILNQTDPKWHLIIVDDCSPCQEAIDFLDEIKSLAPEKITIIKLKVNLGPGIARNIGIKIAVKRRYPFILFNDCDDISHPRRVEVTREIFLRQPDVSMAYSTFDVVDEQGGLYKYEELPFMIQEILDSHRNPPQGNNAWIRMGTETGYCNLTSSTSVLTTLAWLYPFPGYSISEDTHTWFRYSAGGDNFYYSESIPSRYFIPRFIKETMTFSRSKSREDYFREKVRNEEEGFLIAMKIAIEKGKLDPKLKESLLLKFKLKSAETLYRASCKTVAREIIVLAMSLSKEDTSKLIGEMFSDTLLELVV